MIVSYRDKRTREFATGKRVKAFSGIERSAWLRLDRLEAAASLGDLAALPGRAAWQPVRGPQWRPEGPVQHSNQRPVAYLFRMAGGFGRASQRGDR
jgi:proteic killer suppression protein